MDLISSTAILGIRRAGLGAERSERLVCPKQNDAAPCTSWQKRREGDLRCVAARPGNRAESGRSLQVREFLFSAV
jgi:hypothetical protein